MGIEEIKEQIQEFAKELGLKNFYDIKIIGYEYSLRTEEYRKSEQYKKDYEELPF